MPLNSVGGLISGLKTNDIVDAMIKADRAATAVLERKQKTFESRLEAVRSYNTRLLTAQIDSASLKRPSTFRSRIATSSAPTAVTATASSNAVVSSSTIDILAIAKAHQIATPGVANAISSNGAGTFTLQVGNNAAKVISPTDTSLDGLAQAINLADAGVTASVLNDGSTGGTPYRLVIQSKQTGSANGISISGSGGLTTLFAAPTTLTPAQDASLRIGSGPSAITIGKGSNTVTDVVPGVTLNLISAANGVTIGVAADTALVKPAVKSFVESMNKAIGYLNDNTGFNAETRTGGILQSDTGLRRALDTAMRAFTGVVPGLPLSLNTMSAVGITIDKQTGKLVLDEPLFDAKLAADPTGVANLFLNGGTSSDVGVQIATVSEKTVAGQALAVDITTAAAQARVGSTADITADGSGNVTIDGTNNTLQLTINGRAVTATLASGIYTRAGVAEQAATAINAQVTSQGDRVVAGLSGNAFDLRTVFFGSAVSLKVTGGSANGVLNLDTSDHSGVNVAGSIAGVAATGSGQVLTGAVGSSAEGMSLSVSVAGPTLGITVTPRKGAAQQISEKLLAMTNGDTGSVTQGQLQLQKSIDQMKEQVAKVDIRLEARRSRYLIRFARMETLLQQYQSQGSFISGQIAAANKA